VASIACARDGDVHDLLGSLVSAHRVADEREAASKERFLTELGRLQRPCDRYADPVHVTASAVIGGSRGTVLHLHRRLGRWMQPGGHIEPGESPPAAALRESREETGLALEHPPAGPLLLHLDVHSAGDHTHLDIRYLLVGPDADPAPSPGESPLVRWCRWDEAIAIADESLVGALVAALAIIREPTAGATDVSSAGVSSAGVSSVGVSSVGVSSAGVSSTGVSVPRR